MDLSAFSPRLRTYRIAQLQGLLYRLEEAIEAGVVPNSLFTPTKDAINRAVDEAFDHYQAETKDYSNRVLVMGAYNVPAAIKEAVKQNATGRLELLQALLPLHNLLQAAKPLIRKKGQAVAPDKFRGSQK